MRALVIGSLILLGCGGPQPPVDPNTGPCNHPATLTMVQTKVFNGCGTGTTGCHAMGPPFGANLDLTAGHSYSDLLHVESRSSQSKFLVEPGDPDKSFLWHKLDNQIDPNGSEGAPMPRSPTDGWTPLTLDELELVRCWIEAGAKDD